MVEEYEYKNLKSIGLDVFINGFCQIRRPHLANLGNHVAIDFGFYCTTGLQTKDYVHIGPHVTVIGGEKGVLKMGNFTTISAGARLICCSDNFEGEGLCGYGIPKEFQDKMNTGGIILEDFVSVATNTVIFPGVRLRQGSVIAAGAVVTKDTKPWTIYKGIPAREFKSRPNKVMFEMAKSMGYDIKEEV